MKTRIPERIDNYYFVRERGIEEPDWFRPVDFVDLDLPHPVVLCNGAFDILHSGHMKILFSARRRAKTLVIALDGDARVARKGPGRPIQTFIERATALRYMPVDYIVEIRDDEDMADLVATLRPDLRVQGADYKDHISRFSTPKCFVRANGMRTSEIIRRCKLTPDA